MKKVIGLDLGDKQNVMVVLDEKGTEMKKASIPNNRNQILRFVRRYPDAVVVMEAGTHSPWVSRLLKEHGYEVLVGDPRRLRAIWDSKDKSDEKDARILALIYRLSPQLLHPVQQRSEEAQEDLAIIKARQQLVECRAKLINHVRGTVKALGYRIPSCSAATFHKRALLFMKDSLKSKLELLLGEIAGLTARIQQYEYMIEEVSREKYPETECLQQIKGVGEITSLAYVLTLEEPKRFKKSRTVGAFLGMTPKRDQSGATDKQLKITKAGNTYLRQLLVTCSHYILGHHGPDCDLRRHGLRLAARGGKNAKKRAVVATARKLAVLLHRLWSDGTEYIPLKGKQKIAANL